MNLSFTEEQLMLRDTVARLFASESTPTRVREAEADGFDRNLWEKLVELGIPMMRVPAEAGGSDMGMLEALLVAEEAGRHLVSAPIAESLPAARLLAQLDGPEAAELLSRIAQGAVVSLLPQPLDETAPLVLPGARAAEAVLAMEGKRIFALRGEALQRQQVNLGSDSCVVLDINELASLERQHLASSDGARRTFLAAVEEWKLLKGAMLAGLARQAIQLAADYSCERSQFGKLIGSFQGIAHPLADALTEIEGAHLLLWHAVSAIARNEPDASALVPMAWWWSGQSANRAVARALHSFGGYGVSLEYDIQLYYRRARAWSLLTGDPVQELDAIADRLWNPESDTPLPEAGEVSLEFGYGDAAARFAEEVRTFFETNLTDDLKAHAHHSVDGYHAGFNRQLAEAGLLYPHWPEEWGGRGKNAFDMHALQEVFESFNWQRITGPITNQVAQIVMRFASEEAKQEALPRFARGEALACLGFSEPSCGSDVFAARTRATRTVEGDWLIEGQKIFTTAANLADYCFLLARTDPDAPKHAGLTLFLVPMDLPGIEVHPVYTVQDERTNITYLSGVRLPDRYRVGEVNAGTSVMAATLELEHSGDQYRISFWNMYRHAVDWAREQGRLGEQDVRRRLAKVAVHTTIARDLCYRATWSVQAKAPNRAAYGPMSKLFSTEQYQRDAVDLMELCAPYSLLRDDHGVGLVELGYRQSIGMTIYGGTSEIHRSLIAEQGLGMPRSRT
ncbi:acyl-CoA dehydrogenase [Metapseudomonas resinovorans]|uniref:acyl-CoA dehydrogenase n=1 Tax=Pseudomonadaceae TaxID=135621 RepID=UPI000986901C|nr:MULTISPECIES: acyl-CoA dehydrogenase [Pseudomonas]NWL80944.1 acyl-CoA dehydrogenase [Pseudomonas taiwanensis]GLZ84460.1 acyl-CoA dehydrogenase [Pseudomonas resinovorans]